MAHFSGSQAELNTFSTEFQALVDATGAQITSLHGAKDDFHNANKSQTGTAVQGAMVNAIQKTTTLKNIMDEVSTVLRQAGGKINEQDLQGHSSIISAGNFDGVVATNWS